MDYRQVSVRTVGLVLFSFMVVICSVFYVPLLFNLPDRTPSTRFFFGLVLPRGLTHLSILFLLICFFKVKARGACIFWVLSGIALLAAGGLARAVAACLTLIFALILIWIGDHLSRFTLLEDGRGWGASMAFGIVLLSLLGAFLSWVHLFKGWVLLLSILPFLVLAFLRRASLAARLSACWCRFSASWNVTSALAIEGVFLVGMFLFVGATAPETRYDAVTRYWPYLKLLERHSGFFELPYQWWFVIPQAGLSYAGSIYLLLGPQAVRWSMLLAWLALLGMAWRGLGDGGCINGKKPSSQNGINLAVALILASCPLVLLETSSLMQDTFVALVAVLLALVCLRSKDAGSIKFWAVVGGLMGLAWTTKYNLVNYAIPLGCCAFLRSWKVKSWKRSLGGAALGVACALLTAAPWVWNTYRLSGNPLFPLLLKTFPSPLWSDSVWPDGIVSVGRHLSPGLKGWLLWPVEMTYQTDRFVEGYPGNFGLVLPFLLFLGFVALWKTTVSTKALLFSSILGTALIWRLSPYLRYWLPGLWLFCLAVAPGGARLAGSPRSRLWLCAVAVAVSLLHLPFAMAHSWFDPKGWPWDFYSGKIKEAAYLERYYPGFGKFQELNILDSRWPRVWFTDYEGVGHLQAVPLCAALWELKFHGAMDPRSYLKYLGSAGCEYWIVNKDGQSAAWFQKLGLSSFYWDDSHLVSSDGPVSIYKMKSWKKPSGLLTREPDPVQTSSAEENSRVTNLRFSDCGQFKMGRSWFRTLFSPTRVKAV